ncbi:kinase-like domain-containing protein [Tanacetum coccineum]|uniref:Kinase-like domain-containing protein n=1 Tax=Tanacetum coccineum TaxID=301880 RepID=A0ABQ5E7U7_9ASTR
MKSSQAIIYLSSSSRISFLFYGLAIICLTSATDYASGGGNETDYLALLLFKSNITHDPYKVLASWNHSFHFCEWSGISCGKRHKRVTVLRLDSQGLEGSLSPHVGNLSFLRKLGLWNNSFQGTIPHELGRLFRLRRLYLEVNKFSGVIPTNLSGCSNLERLSLGENMLVGSIPKEMSLLSKLTDLVINDNKLTGGIPPFLGNITSMEVFDATGNPFGGSIPNTLCHWKILTGFYCYDCNLYGIIPRSIFNLSLRVNFSLPELRDIDRILLNNNNFHGRGGADDMRFINSLRNCTKLVDLELGNCNLIGMLPISIGNISILGECIGLSTLNLRGNIFQGIIPLSLSSLRGPEVFDISQNNLSGVFANTSAFSVLGNNKLCGGLVTLELPKCKERGSKKTRFPYFIFVIVIAPTLLIIICCVYLLCMKKGNSQPSQSLVNERFLKVSYSDLLKATDGFTADNLIGEGGFSSVYKGILDSHDDRFVAIKDLHLQSRGAHRSFLAECEARRNIRHRNLFKIITSCSSVDFQGNDFKDSVYEYMPNGSVHDWLHSSANTLKLNLLQRVNILNDVATALDYLHNHCQTTIVHGDLKPSNILLDDDMVAHVGDFGLARLLVHRHKPKQLDREYGIGSEMTSSGDVYSFGILLLEVMTGKKPTDGMFNEGLSLHKFAYMALPDHVIDVIDNDAIVLQSTEANAKKVEECLIATIKIGVSCSLDSPPQRMKIEIVVIELQRILDWSRRFIHIYDISKEYTFQSSSRAAKRVAKKMETELGDLGGYAIRFEDVTGHSTKT